MIVPLLRFATDKRLGGATLIWRPVQLQWLAAFGDDSLRLVVGAAGKAGWQILPRRLHRHLERRLPR